MRLPQRPCSVEWYRNKRPLHSPQVGPQSVGLLPGAQTGVAPARSLGGLLSNHWICPWVVRTGPGLWLRGPRTKPRVCFRLHKPKLRSADLTLEAWMGVSPSSSLGGLDYSLPVGGGAEVGWTAPWLWLEGLEPCTGPFQDLWGAQTHVSFIRSLCQQDHLQTMAGMVRSPIKGKLSESTVWLSLLGLPPEVPGP